MRFLNTPRNGVLTAIFALAIVDSLHALRPTFIHPQNNLDVFTKLIVWVLVFGPFIFGGLQPLSTIFMRLCDSKSRKSYSAIAFRNHLAWYVLLALAMFLSYRYGWFFHATT